MNKIKKPLLFALCLLPIALLGGIFTSLYQLDILSPAMIEQLLAELGSRELLIVIGALQAAAYALFCGFFGHILADQVGLWRQIRIERKSFLFILAISTLGGIVFSLDYWVFGSFISEGMETEIARAKQKRMKIRYFTEDLKEEAKCS